MVSLIVGVAGVIGSGKTSVARVLGEKLPESEVRSFGEVVRAAAIERGRGVTRKELQDTGEELVHEGWPAFVDRLLTPEPVSDVLIVDGIRHPSAAKEVGARWPEARMVLVYIRPSDAAVAERNHLRGESPDANKHPVEQELSDVRAQAHLVLVDEDLARNVARVVEAVQQH